MFVHRFFETLGRECGEIEDGSFATFQDHVPNLILYSISFVRKHALRYLPGLEYLTADDAVKRESPHNSARKFRDGEIAVFDAEKNDVAAAPRAIDGVIQR